MNREKLATVVFWVSLPLLVVCTWLALTLPMKVATGIPGERVTLGMSVSQVIEQAGHAGPDGPGGRGAPVLLSL